MRNESPRRWLGGLALGVAIVLAAHGAEPAAGDERRHMIENARHAGVTWTAAHKQVDGSTRTLHIALLTSPNAAARARINAWLAKNVQPPEACEEGSCDDGNNMEVQFANERFFALAGSSYESGGAHGSNGFLAVTFDLRTGKPVVWPEVLRIDGGAGPGRPLDLRRTDLLAALVLRELQDPKYADDCFADVVLYYGCEGDRCNMEQAESQPPSGWSVYPTEAGLAVAPDAYSEAARGCRGTTMTVPWAEVAKTQKQPLTLP